jgi:hypothetical protein
MKRLIFKSLGKLYLILGTLIILFSNGCIDQAAYENIELGGERTFAVPLVDSRVSVSSIAEEVQGNTSVLIGSDGKLTVFYNGEVVRNNSTVLFPPLPGIVDNVLPDTNSLLPLPLDPQYKITKANFGKTNMFFRFLADDTDDYIVKVKIPNMTKDGKSFEIDYELNYKGQVPPEYYTFLTNIDGWTITPEENKIRFIYEAYNSNGERVKFDYAAMKVDQLIFGYVEGYFSYHVFDIEGSNIGVSLFESWVRGGMDFENPKMSINVENAFGFPVRSKVNYIRLETLSGQEFELESQYINQGIDFGYPTIQEVGEVKLSGFSFDNSNSNLRQLFNEKVVNVTYDIDALANPDNDESISNFVDSSSFFSVKVALEVPMHGKANDFTLKQESEVDFTDLQEIHSATFKSIITNDFPTDINLQMYFKSQDGQILDSLFENGKILIEAAPLGTDLRTEGESKREAFEVFDSERFSHIMDAVKVETQISLNNTSQSQESLWIYDDYEIGLRLGATIQLK